MESRPQTFRDLVMPEVTSKLLHAIVRNSQPCSLLLHGSPGVGKTSTIECLCNELNERVDWFSKSRDVLVLNASDDRGLETVRTTVKSFVEHSGLHPRVVVMDEIDAMTAIAQRSLAYLLTSYNCYLLATCNYLCHVDASLRDTCLLIQMPAPQMGDSIRMLANSTGVPEEVAAEQYRRTNGDLRTARNYCVLQSKLPEPADFLTEEQKLDQRAINLIQNHAYVLVQRPTLLNEIQDLVLTRRVPITTRSAALTEIEVELDN
jgi:DNA polymerase III delta prime subunit